MIFLPAFPWLTETAQCLARLHTRRTLPHALLFQGGDQASQAALMAWLVPFLLCMAPVNARACQTCRACLLYLQESHPDLLILGKDENTISIDAVREVIPFLQHTTHQGGLGLVVLHDADRMGIQASNALLKSLEEPTPQKHFLLLAQNAADLLPTLRSRCFKIQLPFPPENFARQNSPIFEKWKVLFQQVFLKSEKNGFFEEAFQPFLQTHSEETLYLLYDWLMDLVKLQLHQDTAFFDKEEAMSQVQSLGIRATPSKLLNFLKEVTSAIQMNRMPGINKSFLFESLLYKWYTHTE